VPDAQNSRPARRLIPAPAAAAVTIALGYYLGAKLGFALTLAPLPVSTLWPPNAILLAGLVLTPSRSWPVVLTAVFGAHLAVQIQSGIPPGMVLGWFISNCMEALIGAVLLRRFRDGAAWFETFRNTAVFFGCAGVAAPFISSFIDAAFVALNHWGDSGYWTVWRTRFFSNALAAITLVPLILTTADSRIQFRQMPRRRLVEAAVGFIALVVVCWVVFVNQLPGPGTLPALLYTPLPLLVAAAVRLGPWATSASILTCALIAIQGAVLGQGPFVTSSPFENALGIQLFLIAVWIPVMSLAAVVRERVRAELKAQLSEQQLAMAIDVAQVGRWEWDISDQRVTCSDYTRRLYEVPLDVPVSTETFQSLVHPDDQAMIAAVIADAVTGRAVDIEFRIRFPDGRIKWILSRGQPVSDLEGRPVRLVGVNVDITARKCAELQIHEQRSLLAQLSRVSVAGELSIALAHEMNQPLAAILANASAARRFLRHDPPNLRELGDIVQAITEDNRRAAAIVTRFGALARNDPNWARLNINDVVASVLDVARDDIVTRGVSMTKELAEGLPQVLGDAVQLQHLLLNLVINACDAMAPLTFGSRRLLLTTEGDDESGLRVTVRDSGPGIPADFRERVFEPLVTSKAQRLGLGLAICRSIAVAHDGRIGVDNDPSGGATFVVYLPAAGESESVDSSAVPSR
jgi:two-component system, LuxR family, sensor kinase FixL